MLGMDSVKSTFNKFSARICPLFVPANRDDFLQKTTEFSEEDSPDVLVFDLEDSIEPHFRASVREKLKQMLVPGSLYRSQLDNKYPGGMMVRINGSTTDFAKEDRIAVREIIRPNFVLIPKVGSGRELREIQEYFGEDIECVPALETLAGYRNREEIFCALKERNPLGSLVVGYEDLSSELGIDRPRRISASGTLSHILHETLISAAYHKIVVFDGICRFFRGREGELILAEESDHAFSLGMRGKFAIHPNQVPLIRKSFQHQKRISQSFELMEQFERVASSGSGVIVREEEGLEQMEDLPSKRLAERRTRHLFQDRSFGEESQSYQKSRPQYPREIFQFLSTLSPSHELALDVGTGNGQAALALAEHFEQVVGIDVDSRQLSYSSPHPRIRYFRRPCDCSGLPVTSVDLVTVATAVHWFPLESFYAEVDRVLKPQGILAVWTYCRPVSHGPLEELLKYYYEDLLIPLLPAPNRWQVSLYRDLPFPRYEEIMPPQFEIRERWTLDRLLEMMKTPAPRQQYLKSFGEDPLDLVSTQIREVFGEEESREICFPLGVRVARKTLG